jgi:hypothetical protein
MGVVMQVITILCPAHNTEENIHLPETYPGAGYTGSMVYDGQVTCGATLQTKQAVLHIRIHLPTVWVEKVEVVRDTE